MKQKRYIKKQIRKNFQTLKKDLENEIFEKFTYELSKALCDILQERK